MFDIFEQPWGLLIVAVLVLFVVLMLRRIFPRKRYWWQLMLPVFLTVAAPGLDLLVQTDLEKINAVINTAVKAVEKEAPDAIETIISDNYSDSYHNTKKNLMHYLRKVLSKPLVDKNIKRVLTIELSPPKATTILTVRTVFDKQSSIYQNFKSLMLTKVKLNLQKEVNDEWFISKIEILEIDRQPVNWKDIKQANW